MTIELMISHPSTLEEEYPYESDGFRACWWRELAPKFNIEQRHGDWLVHRRRAFGLVIRELTLAGWNNAWNQDLTPDRAIDLLAFRKQTRWDIARLHWSKARSAHQAFDLLKRTGLAFDQLPAAPEYLVDLSEGWEGYLSSISQNTRKSLKKKLRRSLPLSPELVVFEPNQIDQFFEMFFKAHLPYWDKKAGRSYFHDAEERRFIVAWARTLATSGHLLLQGTRFNGEWVNLSMSILSGETLYWLLTINTGQYAEFVPGMVALGLQLNDAVERGIRLFNMGSGDYFYKIQMSNRIDNGFHLLIANPDSIRGRVYAEWLKQRLYKTTDNK